MLTLSEDLRDKLCGAPQGATTSYFDAGEQAELTAVFGTDWAIHLGIQ